MQIVAHHLMEMTSRSDESLCYAIWLYRRMFQPHMHLFFTAVSFCEGGYYPRGGLPFL